MELTNLIYLIIFLNNISGNEIPNDKDDKDKLNCRKQICIELLIVIREENSNKDNFIKDIEEKDMNNWINESNIDIYQTKFNKFHSKFGINFTIINKTYLSSQNKNFMKNNDIKDRQEEILNLQQKTISPKMQNKLANKMLYNFTQMKNMDSNSQINLNEINDKIQNNEKMLNTNSKIDEYCMKK